MRLERKHSSLCQHSGCSCVSCLTKAGNPFRTVDSLWSGPVQVKRALEQWFTDWAWPGGYPIIFVLDSGDVLCAECAKREFLTHQTDSVTADIHYEGPSIFCDECSKEIESAYGDPDAMIRGSDSPSCFQGGL